MKIVRSLLPARAFGARRFSAAPVAVAGCCSDATVAAWWHESKGRLLERLSVLGATRGALWEALDRFVSERKTVKKREFERCVKDFRKFRRFHHAFEILHWMENRGIVLSYPAIAIRLDITSKTQGIAAAQSYFDALPPSARNQLTYGALLNCYCEEQLAEKALSLFLEMDQIGWANHMAFNSLMSLYLRVDQPGKVPYLISEMKRRDIFPTTFTYVYWMTSCACLNDIEGAERVAALIEKENERTANWTIHSNLAAIYVKAGSFEKAKLVLRKIEDMRPRNRMAYHLLISLYAKTSNLDAVNRVWNVLKSKFRRVNMSYLAMLHALAELDDVNGLKDCFEEWVSWCSIFDLRLVNVAMRAYLKWHMLKDAQQVFHLATERSLNLFSTEAAVTESRTCEWQPDPDIVREFFHCFEVKKDTEGAEELCRMLKKINCLDSGSYKSLIKIYLSAGRVVPDMHHRVEQDGVVISSRSELENLLHLVSGM